MIRKRGTCEICGEESEWLSLVDQFWMCEFCLKDFRIDHPDMEEQIAAAEHQYDILTDR
jgi:hypothetical protein